MHPHLNFGSRGYAMLVTIVVRLVLVKTVSNMLEKAANVSRRWLDGVL